MPRGTYLHLDEGVAETFQCAPGPGGWRYVGERADGVRTDLVVDSRWRQIRVEIVAPAWWARGGVTGPAVAWVRGAGDDAAGHDAPAKGFLGESPGFLVAVARSLDLAEGAQADVRLVRLSGPNLAALTVAERWRLADVTAHDTDSGPLPVERYEVADLATGEIRSVHLAGDVVVDAPGVELTDLESPPNLRA
ncbi:hypothetical protein [Actinomadura hibisca]|uniref:hypothetical protein n=1 Tax=Actinomadura hibisca TaxID=68565 RepID=UPI0008364E51|nr:hypothetical protein [Actinomadura hibisca]